MSQRDFFRQKRSTNCGTLLATWAEQRNLPVHSTARVHAPASAKRAPHSELCMQTRCAGRPVRAFAFNPRPGSTSAIIYTDKNGQCRFESGLPTEILPPEFWRAHGGYKLSGARGRRGRGFRDGAPVAPAAAAPAPAPKPAATAGWWPFGKKRRKRRRR